MSTPEKKIDSVYDFTDKGLVELKAWLEPWFQFGGGAVEWEDVGVGCGPQTMSEIILSHNPWGFWKLNESTGSIAADSSGNSLDMSTTSPELDPVWGASAGPPGEQAADFGAGTGGYGGTAVRVSRTWEALTDDFTVAVFVNRNSTIYTQVIGQGNPGRAGGTGWMLAIHGTGDSPFQYPYLQAAGLGTAAADGLLPALTWAMLAVSVSGTTWTLNINGVDQAAGLSGSYTASSSPLWIGHDAGLSGVDAVTPAYFVGSYAFLIHSALTAAELLEIYEAGTV